MVLVDELSIPSYSGGQHFANFMLTIENAPDGLLFAELQVPDERCSPLFLATPTDFRDVEFGRTFTHHRGGFSLEFSRQEDRLRVVYKFGDERSVVTFLISDFHALLDKLEYERDQSPHED